MKIRRRSFDVRPPVLAEDDYRNPRLSAQYRDLSRCDLPLCESLKNAIASVLPYYDNVVFKEMQAGKRVLITAHGNSIRALVKTLENLSNEEIMEINIPTGVPLVYEFDEQWEVVKKYYLGDAEFIKAKANSVANQGKAALADT